MSAAQSPAVAGRLDDLVVGEIRAWMGRRRLTQSSFANKLGERQQWISRRLSGAVPLTLDDVEKIAGALDVPPLVLITGGNPDGFNSPFSRTPGAKRTADRVAPRVISATSREREDACKGPLRARPIAA